MNEEIELSPSQAFMILLAGARNEEHIKGKTWLQKEMFLIAKNTMLKEVLDFEPHLYGPYSETVDVELENLEVMGLLEENGNIQLTEEGRKYYKKISEKASRQILDLISEIKEELNDLSKDELLAYIYFGFPETTEEAVRLEKIMKNRVKLAIRLYKKGKVSIGKAADIADMDVKSFMGYLRSKEIKIPLSL